MTIRTNSLKCFAVRAVGNAVQPQISIINEVSNLTEELNKEKLLKEDFHRGHAYAAIVSLLEKRHGVRMHVRMREEAKK